MTDNIILETDNFIMRDDGKLIIKEGVKVIDQNFRLELMFRFFSLDSIKSIEIPNTVEKIESSSFMGLANLKSVKIPSSVKEIGFNAFSGCCCLEDVELAEGLEVIGGVAFYKAPIKNINIPDSVKEIGPSAFCGSKFKSVKIPKSLKTLNHWCFDGCSELENIEFSEGLETINGYLFQQLPKVKEVKFPNSLKLIDSPQALEKTNLKRINMSISTVVKAYGSRDSFSNVEIVARMQGEEIVLQKGVISKDMPRWYDESDLGDEIKVWRTYDESNAIIFKDGRVVLVDSDGVMITTREELMKRATKTNEISSIIDANLALLKPYLKYKFVPHKDVVLAFSFKDVPLFYKNANYNRWAKITNKMEETGNYDKFTMVKLAYRLGVFSGNVKESEIATRFICEEIMDKLNAEEIHAKFNNLPMGYRKYDRDSAQFFMINYIKNPNFLEVYDENAGVVRNRTAEMFEKFSNVKKLYPYKKVVTRHDNERLTVNLVLKALDGKVEYEISEEKAEELAKAVGEYGYSQENYKALEKWFIMGLNIPEDKITLKIEDDDVIDEIKNTPAVVDGDDGAKNHNQQNVVTYELLEKDDPLCAVLGEITNCCQVVGGAGEECVEYGMTQPNSGFLVFKDANCNIIGQSWVWYDKESKTVCLDNIEVPSNVIESLEKNKEQQKEFLKCLVRTKLGFINAMGVGKVKNVTIGKGFNDIAKLLNDNFEVSKEVATLSNYDGYSDARNSQYIVPDRIQIQRNDEEKEM